MKVIDIPTCEKASGLPCSAKRKISLVVYGLPHLLIYATTKIVEYENGIPKSKNLTKIDQPGSKQNVYLYEMSKKSLYILLLFSALAIMLGHNFVPHHHHGVEHNQVGQYHYDGYHHYDDTENNSNSKNECGDWSHLFSGIQHGADGFIFLTNHCSSEDFAKQITPFAAIELSDLALNQIILEVMQSAPPCISDYYNSKNFLPSGLRAPPISIV